MSQADLDFGPLHRSADSARRAYAALKEAIGHLGLGTMADAIGIDGSDLRRALDRKQRGVWIEYALAIGSVAPAKLRAELAAALVEPLGFAVVPLRPLTAEEKLTRAKRLLIERLGDVGKQIAEELER